MDREDIKKQITIAVVLVFIVSVILILTGSAINLSIRGTQEREAQKYMKEIVSQYKNIIAAQTEGDLQALEAAAAFVGDGGAVDGKTALPYLKDYLDAVNGSDDFIRMGIVTPDCLGYYIDADGGEHDGIDVGDEEFVRSALSGRRVISDLTEDRMAEGSVIVYGVPITHGGKVIGAVTATRTTSNLADIIGREIFGGAAYLHIVEHP